MPVAALAPPENVAELVHRLGDVPLDRIRLLPAPGAATEADLLALLDGPPEKVLCELVDGTLVEKPMGQHESRLAACLIHFLMSHLDENDIAVVGAPDSPFRLPAGLLRLPDISVTLRSSLPAESEQGVVADCVPELVVEILSESNAKAEMDRKLGEYFDAGVRLVWSVEPRDRSAIVHRSREDFDTIDENGALDGGDVLPGFPIAARPAVPTRPVIPALDPRPPTSTNHGPA